MLITNNNLLNKRDNTEGASRGFYRMAILKKLEILHDSIRVTGSFFNIIYILSLIYIYNKVL